MIACAAFDCSQVALRPSNSFSGLLSNEQAPSRAAKITNGKKLEAKDLCEVALFDKQDILSNVERLASNPQLNLIPCSHLGGGCHAEVLSRS